MVKINKSEIPEHISCILSGDELERIVKNTDSLIDIAYDLIEIEEYENSLDLLTYCYELHGFTPDLLNGLAVAYSEMDQSHKALRIMKKASDMYPDDAVTLANTATLFWENGDYAKAIYYYNLAIKENNTLLDAYINLINLHYECGDIFIAFITCLKILQVFPDDRQILDLRDELIFDMAISFS
ncbi:MAG: tetratricopeptide repeat protein [Spirochaetes bacterium]|nr:tetratricopeptide repeat protein [Spirochaetota bacterium]